MFLKLIFGREKETYATIEKSLPVSYYNNTYRGIWKRGVLWVVFLLLKPIKCHLKLHLCGFVFDPANTKRMHVKEFEAIL